ncbi:MAG: DUF1360 domain-containing protein [Bacillus sp. (in: firmicutes)]
MVGNIFDLFLLSLASFRLTRLIVFDKITAFLRKPFFEEVEETNAQGEAEIYIVPKKSGFKGWMGQLLSCYWCTGVWMAIFLVVIDYFFSYWSNPIIVVLAVAGLAALFETVVQKLINE